MLIPKVQLTNRLKSGTPNVDACRTVIDGAYGLAEQAETQRRELYGTRASNTKQVLKEAVESDLGPRLANLARLVAPIRERVLESRKPHFVGHECRPSPEMIALGENVALADAALWAARKDLSAMSGVSEVSISLMEPTQAVEG